MLGVNEKGALGEHLPKPGVPAVSQLLNQPGQVMHPVDLGIGATESLGGPAEKADRNRGH